MTDAYKYNTFELCTFMKYNLNHKIHTIKIRRLYLKLIILNSTYFYCISYYDLTIFSSNTLQYNDICKYLT